MSAGSTVRIESLLVNGNADLTVYNLVFGPVDPLRIAGATIAVDGLGYSGGPKGAGGTW